VQFTRPYAGPFEFGLFLSFSIGQRLDPDRCGGEGPAPRQHDCSSKIGELKSEGAGQNLAAGGRLDSPNDLNSGYTNILSWVERPVSGWRRVGRSIDEPFERGSNLASVTYRLPRPEGVAEIGCERRPCESGVFAVERNGDGVGEDSPGTKGGELCGERHRATGRVNIYRDNPRADNTTLLVLSVRGVKAAEHSDNCCESNHGR